MPNDVQVKIIPAGAVEPGVQTTSGLAKPLPLASTDNTRRQQEEYGKLITRALKLVTLKFGGAPIWLLGLYPIKIETIYIRLHFFLGIIATY